MIDAKNGIKVVVVGAGLGGIVCAQSLADKGFEVTIVDKGRQAGGRLASRERQPSFDYGAQYLTASDSFFQDVVANWSRAGLVSPWCGRFAQAEISSDFSLVPSVPHKERYVGVPKMNSFVVALAAELNKSAALLSQHRVISLEINSSNCFSILGEKTDSASESAIETFSLTGFDYAVLNMPPPQIVALINTVGTTSGALAGRLLTSKALDLVKQVELSPCFALMVQLASSPALEYDGIKVANSPLAWVARDSSKPQRAGENWVLHASPQWSNSHIEDSLSDVTAALLAEFELLNKKSLPPVLFAKCHRWRYALPQNPLALGALFDSANKIGYCGDWCQGNNIEAAYLSGRHMAEAIVRDSALTS
ncbi:MAG: NAD(P)-binding protein [Candidatus Obscuribacterales bacterium]|jgi:hypothetical protein